MKIRILLLASLLIGVMLFAACAPQGETPAELTAIRDLGSLSKALRDAGATIESNETIMQEFFTVEGRILKVNGSDVQVFEYKSSEAMETEAALVAPDGGSVGTSMVMWMATPHFFKAGRMIVLYVGDDATVYDLLKSALGEQFAGR